MTAAKGIHTRIAMACVVITAITWLVVALVDSNPESSSGFGVLILVLSTLFNVVVVGGHAWNLDATFDRAGRLSATSAVLVVAIPFGLLAPFIVWLALGSGVVLLLAIGFACLLNRLVVGTKTVVRRASARRSPE